MDDSIVAEIQWFQDGGRCTRALLPLASDGFRLLGKRGSDDPLIHVIRTADNQLGFAICSAGMHRGHRHAAIDDAAGKGLETVSSYDWVTSFLRVGVGKRGFPAVRYCASCVFCGTAEQALRGSTVS